MKGLLDEGNDVYLLPNNDPKRKLKYGLEIIKTRKNLVVLILIWLIKLSSCFRK
jgi:DNA-binding sugar fermentation-stimulating protein